MDGCSTDHPLETIRQYKDTGIQVISNQVNSRVTVSGNNAIEAANGRWIAFLDSDDLWDKDKLLRHIQFVLKAQTAFSFTNYFVLNIENKFLHKISHKS